MSEQASYAPYIRFDADVVAAYIKLTDEPIAETSESHPRVLLDLDESGGLVGIEIFGQEIVDLITSQLSGGDDAREMGP